MGKDMQRLKNYLNWGINMVFWGRKTPPIKIFYMIGAEINKILNFVKPVPVITVTMMKSSILFKVYMNLKLLG
jgi:hypothetical protein